MKSVMPIVLNEKQEKRKNKMAMSDVLVTENAMIQHKDKTAKKP